MDYAERLYRLYARQQNKSKKVYWDHLSGNRKKMAEWQRLQKTTILYEGYQ